MGRSARQAVLLGTWLLCVGSVSGCGKDDKQALVDRAEQEHAAELTAALDGAAFDKSVAEALQVQRKKLAEVAFPVLQRTVECDQSALEVRYDPYQDEVRLTVYQPGALDEQLRWLALGETRVFEDTKPFQKPDKLLDQAEQARPQVTLEQVSTKLPELFALGKKASLELSAETMVAAKVSDTQFRYEPFEHAGWTITLHVMSSAERRAIDEHAQSAKRASAEIYVLEEILREKADRLRGSKLPAAVQALARYDERLAAANKRKRELATIPQLDKKASFSVTHEPPCP